MRRLLIIGCGDVAMRAIPLLKKSFHLYALVRDPDKRGRLRALGVEPLLGDLDYRSSLDRVAGLADAVLHLAPPPNMGSRDTRTRNLLRALSQGRGRRRKLHRRLVYISTSGVYGDCGGGGVGGRESVAGAGGRPRGPPRPARPGQRVETEPAPMRNGVGGGGTRGARVPGAGAGGAGWAPRWWAATQGGPPVGVGTGRTRSRRSCQMRGARRGCRRRRCCR